MGVNSSKQVTGGNSSKQVKGGNDILDDYILKLKVLKDALYSAEQNENKRDTIKKDFRQTKINFLNQVLKLAQKKLNKNSQKTLEILSSYGNKYLEQKGEIMTLKQAGNIINNVRMRNMYELELRLSNLNSLEKIEQGEKELNKELEQMIKEEIRAARATQEVLTQPEPVVPNLSENKKKEVKLSENKKKEVKRRVIETLQEEIKNLQLKLKNTSNENTKRTLERNIFEKKTRIVELKRTGAVRNRLERIKDSSRKSNLNQLEERYKNNETIREFIEQVKTEDLTDEKRINKIVRKILRVLKIPAENVISDTSTELTLKNLNRLISTRKKTSE